MSQVSLAARTRALRRKNNRFLRRAGITPANLYGAGLDSIALQVDTKALIRVLAGTVRNTPISLQIAGEAQPRTAFIWSLQRDPLTEDLLHIDFYHVEATRTMRAKVPLVLEGVDPLLERFKKRVAQLLDALDVECLPGDLPPQLRVDVTALKELGDSVAVSAIAIDDKVTVLTDPSTVVAKVMTIVEVKEKVEEAPVEAAAEGEAAPAEEGAEGEEKAEEEEAD